MKWYKRWAAALLAGLLGLLSAGCAGGETTWIAKAGDTTVPTGVYLYSLMEATSYASYLVENPMEDVRQQTVEGMDATLWIQDKALESVRFYLTVMQEFEKRNLTLPQEELDIIEEEADAVWQQQQQLLKQNGITRDSLEFIGQANLMGNQVFYSIYGEGGEKEIPLEELQQYYDQNYIKLAAIISPLPQKPVVSADATPQELEQREAMYQMELDQTHYEINSWFLQAQAGEISGEDFNQIINQRNQSLSSDPDRYDMTADHFQLLPANGTSLSATIPSEVVAQAKEIPLDAVTRINTENYAAVVVRMDIHQDPQDFQAVRQELYYPLRGQEYTAWLQAQQDAIASSVEINQEVIRQHPLDQLRLG